MWEGLGINVGTQFSWDQNNDLTQFNADLDYLKAVGFTKVRVTQPLYDGATRFSNPDGFLKWRNMCAEAKARNFYVIWGLGESGITSANWAAAKQAFKDEAIAAQATGDVDVFSLGNELQINHDGSITNLTIDTDIAALATDLKENHGITMDLITSVAQNNLGSWPSLGIAGMGGLDAVTLQVYGEYNNFPNFKSNIDTMLSIFGVSKTYITEFNLDSSWSIPWSLNETLLSNGLKQRMDYIRASGMTDAYFYIYRNSGANPAHAIKKSDDKNHWYFDRLIYNPVRSVV